MVFAQMIVNSVSQTFDGDVKGDPILSMVLGKGVNQSFDDWVQYVEQCCPQKHFSVHNTANH